MFGFVTTNSRWLVAAARWMFIAIAIVSPIRAVHAASDLLDPHVAFGLSGQMITPNQVLLRFRIAEGYYLYRDKIRVSVAAEPPIVLTMNLPKGKVKQDEFFGRVEIYRGDISVPVSVALPKDTESISVNIISQGCADVGVCYPPQEQKLELGPKLGVVSASGKKKSPGESLIDKLRQKQ